MNEIIQIKNEYRRQRWAEAIRQCQESGMTVTRYCEANGLKAKTYYYWLRKLREEVCQQTVVAIPGMTGSNDASGTAAVRMCAGDLVVEIENTASVATIEAVIRALQIRC
jgi:hypothetical protein